MALSCDRRSWSRKQIERDEREREARLATNWLVSMYVREVDKQMQKQKAEGKPFWAPVRWQGVNRLTGFRTAASLQLSQPVFRQPGVWWFGAMYVIQLLFWPTVWVLWAFAWRGGFSFGWLGLALARADGRKAARWQWALRDLLIWAPVTALWAAALALDGWYWSGWKVGDSESWELWLSSGLYWAGVVLLPAYAMLAVLFPKRSLHDWLAGTYVVPR